MLFTSEIVTTLIRLVEQAQSDREARKHKSCYQGNNPNTKRNLEQIKDFIVNDAAMEVLLILPRIGNNPPEHDGKPKRTRLTDSISM